MWVCVHTQNHYICKYTTAHGYGYRYRYKQGPAEIAVAIDLQSADGENNSQHTRIKFALGPLAISGSGRMEARIPLTAAAETALTPA